MSGSSGGRILVVDDRMNRLLLGRVLEQQGHSVRFAEDGQEALDQVRGETYDLVLLDVAMPRVDGFEVLSTMKGDARLRDLPGIVISSLDLFESVIKCIELGAEDYLTKPVNGVLLRARVTSSLEKTRLHERRELISKFATREVADDLLTSGFSLGGKAVDAASTRSRARAARSAPTRSGSCARKSNPRQTPGSSTRASSAWTRSTPSGLGFVTSSSRCAPAPSDELFLIPVGASVRERAAEACSCGLNASRTTWSAPRATRCRCRRRPRPRSRRAG
jgi:CheY-like chemotaxis protein